MNYLLTVNFSLFFEISQLYTVYFDHVYSYFPSPIPLGFPFPPISKFHVLFIFLLKRNC